MNKGHVIWAGKKLFWGTIAFLALVTLAAVTNWLEGYADALHVPISALGPFNFVVVVAWFALLVSSLALMLLRVAAYWRAGMKVPDLLWRDIASKAGLAVPLSAITVVRVLNVLPASSPATIAPISTYLPWLLWTTVPALLGMGTFLFFEIFVIDRWQDIAAVVSEPA